MIRLLHCPEQSNHCMHAYIHTSRANRTLMCENKRYHSAKVWFVLYDGQVTLQLIARLARKLLHYIHAHVHTVPLHLIRKQDVCLHWKHLRDTRATASSHLCTRFRYHVGLTYVLWLNLTLVTATLGRNSMWFGTQYLHIPPRYGFTSQYFSVYRGHFTLIKNALT